MVRWKKFSLGLAVVCLVTCSQAQVQVQAPGGLAAALQATLSQHPAMAGKRAEVKAKVFQGETARAQRYPSLTASAESNSSSVNSNPGNVRTRQPLWAFGRIDASIAYADADKMAQEAEFKRLQRQLLDQVAVAYPKVLGAHSYLRVAQDSVKSLVLLSEQILRREAGQLASMSDVRLSQARLIQAQSLQVRFVGELELAENELLALTQTRVVATTLVPVALTELPAQAMLEESAASESADVLLKRRQVDLARAETGRQKTAAMPTVYLQVENRFNQPVYINGMIAGVVLEGALDGMGLAAVGRSKAAEAQLEAAEKDLESTLNEVARNVRSLWASRQLQMGLMKSQAQSVAEVEALLASYRRQYEAGTKSWLDILNMQRELTDQHMQAAQAENSWLTFTLKIAALTGRLDNLAQAEK